MTCLQSSSFSTQSDYGDVNNIFTLKGLVLLRLSQTALSNHRGRSNWSPDPDPETHGEIQAQILIDRTDTKFRTPSLSFRQSSSKETTAEVRHDDLYQTGFVVENSGIQLTELLPLKVEMCGFIREQESFAGASSGP